MNDNILSEQQELLETLWIENQLNEAQLKALTSSFYRILELLFSQNQAQSLKKEYLHTLYEHSNHLLSLPDLDPVKAQRVLFDLHSFVQFQLRELE